MATAPDSPTPSRSRVSRLVFNRRMVKLVGAVVIVALLYYSFFVLLPQEIDWSAVWGDLSALSLVQLVALVIAGLVTVVALGWTSRASLPGLNLAQGTESSATSQLTAFAFPPPADMAIRFAMYRTYGFTDEQSGVAVLIAMIARYLMAGVLPVLGLGLVLVTGQGSWTFLWWFLGLGSAVAVTVWLLVTVARSPAAAQRVGATLQRATAAVMHRFHRTPPADLTDSVMRFGGRIATTLDTNTSALVASNFVWGMSNALVLLLTMRFCGVDATTVPLASVVLATGLVMAVNLLPIPGKDALIVPWLASVLDVTGQQAISALGAALLLYRVVTWLLPMPVGGITFFTWRWRVRRDTVGPRQPEPV